MTVVDPPDLPLWPTLRRLLRLWREEWRYVAIGLVCALGYTTLSLAIPVLISRAIDQAIVPGHISDLWPYVAGILVLSVIRFFVNFTRRYATSRVGVHIEARMRELLYRSYLDFPRAFYDRHATGQVVSRATNDLYPIRYFIGWGMVQGVQSVLMIVGAAIVLSIVNARLTFFAMLSLPLVGLLAWLFAHRVMPISRQVQARKGDVTESADEAVVGIEMVQAFGREDDVQDRFGERAEGVREVVLQQATVEAHYLPGLYFLPTVSIAAVLWFGGVDVINGNLLIGQFVLFTTVLLQLAWPLEALGWITNLAQRATASAGRTFAWIEGIDRLPEPADPVDPPVGTPSVALHGVHFAYADEDETLRGVELAVEPGEIVAVCGPTGTGKTSLLGLVSRAYDPTAGRVTLDGIDIRHLRIHDLRAQVAVVTQKPVLFSVTLRENLTAGRPDAPWDEVLAACESAGVSEFVDELPDGFDTLIGERGVNLSGGQRQRVALARALLTSARVVVLDDPLSAVDTSTERLLLSRLRPALQGRTVLVATQRYSTVRLADRAVVLLDGRIAQEGTPASLLVQPGPFAELFGDESVAA